MLQKTTNAKGLKNFDPKNYARDSFTSFVSVIVQRAQNSRRPVGKLADKPRFVPHPPDRWLGVAHWEMY
jgi:hypothetical protein